MPWPMNARTTPSECFVAWRSIARPMSESGRPGLTASMPEHQALARHAHQVPRSVVYVADEERGVRVAVHAFAIQRDVEVHDVTVDQWAIVGDAVADDLVDRRAERLGEAVVVERARVPAALDAGRVADRIELVARDAGTDRGARGGEDLGGGRDRCGACAR